MGDRGGFAEARTDSHTAVLSECANGHMLTKAQARPWVALDQAGKLQLHTFVLHGWSLAVLNFQAGGCVCTMKALFAIHRGPGCVINSAKMSVRLCVCSFFNTTKTAKTHGPSPRHAMHPHAETWLAAYSSNKYYVRK